jgi:hypothetical protein
MGAFGRGKLGKGRVRGEKGKVLGWVFGGFRGSSMGGFVRAVREKQRLSPQGARSTRGVRRDAWSGQRATGGGRLARTEDFPAGLVHLSVGRTDVQSAIVLYKGR